jgi:hypothetical protein
LAAIALRDPDMISQLLKTKQLQYDAATLIEYIQTLVTEIEMLKFVLFLVDRNEAK